MNVEIRDRQRKYKLNQHLIKEKAETILSLCGLEDVELSIVIVNNQRIKALNKKYRGIDKPTDVLAFPMDENLKRHEDWTSCHPDPESSSGVSGSQKSEIPKQVRNDRLEGSAKKGGMITSPRLLGDIVISLEKTHSQAREEGHSPTRELLTLLTHGILHLIGYDHERSPLEERRMRRKEKFILNRVMG